MDLNVVFLGTGGSIPTARRATACLLVRRGGDRIMVDCGEGSQRQLQRSLGLIEVDDILLTHLHADHYLGLPGLIKTYDLQDRERPLTVHGPPGTGELFKSLRRVFGRVGYPLELNELEPGEAVQRRGYELRCFPVTHTVRAFGYALVEPSRPGRFDPERARELGVAEGPDFGRLQGGQPVTGSGGEVTPEQVMGPARPGRKLVITGDTAPCEAAAVAAHGAELLVHDSSFADADAERAAETGHSTGRQAAELAAAAEVGMLALVHVSSRYNVREVLDEAREAFPAAVAPRDFDLIEIPFPESGAPSLVPNGAREQPVAAPASA